MLVFYYYRNGVFNSRRQQDFTHLSCSITACPPGTYGDNCSTECPNQHYGENCGLKCNCGPDEKCHTLHGCISRTTSKSQLYT